jgi:hypothetical protein
VKSRAYENSSEKPLCELLTKIQGVTANLPSRVCLHHEMSLSATRHPVMADCASLCKRRKRVVETLRELSAATVT